MNMRAPFLIVALLLGVCYAARCQDLPEPVLAVQRCFPQATVRLLPEVRYHGEVAPVTLTPSPTNSSYGTETISPDGRRLFVVRALEPYGYQSYFLDLTTGQLSLAKMPDQQLIELGGIMPLPYIQMGVWDPVEPAYLYAMRLDHATDEGDKLQSVWRIHVETLLGTPILPTSHDALYDITPDGRYLLVYPYGDGIDQPYLYSLETHTRTPLPEKDMPYVRRTYAPNGELLAGFTYISPNTVLTIMDLQTDRLAQVFNQNQALFSLPHGTCPALVSRVNPTWLFNSTGLFVNIESIDADSNTIWQVGINGEARAIASGVSVIANSQNGRHWLLQHGQRFYVMTVDDTSLVGE